jgi:phosphomannomutase
MKAVEEEFAGRDGVTADHLDGLTVELADGSWFNLRPSNTEPLLRLNVEGRDQSAMQELRDAVLQIVRG